MRRAFLIATATLLSVACATAIRLAPVTPGSVADPDSPEPPPPTMSETLRPIGGGPVVAAPAGYAGHTGDKSLPSETSYTCPMHPEVVSDLPGTCPKCGMKLVPLKPLPDPGSPK